MAAISFVFTITYVADLLCEDEDWLHELSIDMVIQTVREKFSCRECETTTQPPAPFHVTPRSFAGPNLLAMILFEKFGQHQPLNRQSERYRREGVDLSLSTLADQVGAGTTALQPLYALIERHVLAAERLHGAH